MDSFVLKGMPIAKEKKYAKPKMGGLGLINVKDFSDALKCSWFKKIKNSGPIDWWRRNILEGCFFNLNCFRPSQLNLVLRPIEYNIGIAYWSFLKKFWSYQKNIRISPLLMNPCFIRGRDGTGRIDNGLLDAAAIGRDSFIALQEKWLAVTFEDFLTGDAICNYPDAKLKTDINFSLNTYLIIIRAVALGLIKFRKQLALTENGLGINNFLAGKWSGSKPFRRLLTGTENISKGMKTIRSFCEIATIDVPQRLDYKLLLGFWNSNFMPNELRVFSFQWYNNILPVAARVANRYRNNPLVEIDQDCVFCKQIPYNVPGRESFAHLFFSCPTTSELKLKFAEKYLDPGITQMQLQQFLFLGLRYGREMEFVDTLTAMLFNFSIWKCRNIKKKPSFPTLESNMLYLYNGILSSCSWVRNEARRSDNLWCRAWSRGDGGDVGE